MDGTTFTAAAYRVGNAVAHCKILLGGMLGNGISYSHDFASSTSYNDNLTVVYDDEPIGLQGLNMFGAGGGRAEEFLTAEGAAEGYWAIFMEPL